MMRQFYVSTHPDGLRYLCMRDAIDARYVFVVRVLGA